MAKQKKLIWGQAGGKALFEKRGSDHFIEMANKMHARRRRLEGLKKKGIPVSKKRK